MDYWNIMYNVLKMQFRVFLDFKDDSLRHFGKLIYEILIFEFVNVYM